MHACKDIYLSIYPSIKMRADTCLAAPSNLSILHLLKSCDRRAGALTPRLGASTSEREAYLAKPHTQKMLAMAM
jgi:hypothetical protein